MTTVETKDLFEHLPEWRVIVCRQCRCAVWPSEVATHLTNKQHRHPRKVAERIAQEVAEWPGIVPYPSLFELPSFITQSIPQLPLFDDGLQCQLDPTHCQYITRDVKALKGHWRTWHAWSVQPGRGGSGAAKQAALQERFNQARTTVQCQRFFVSRAHSQYVEVRQLPGDPGAFDAVKDSTSIWKSAWQQASECYDEKRRSDIIEPGEIDEVNPWLRRTGWISYLSGCSQADLLAMIQAPDVNVEGTTRNEAIAQVIWSAICEVAIASEDVVRESGVMLRFEVIRTEVDQVKYAPLEVYREGGRVDKRCQPWQQMVMFFVRTQKDHQWQKTPQYRFNRRQQEAFQRLISLAEQEVDQSESRKSGDDSDSIDDDDDDDDGRSISQTEKSQEGSPAKPPKLTPIPSAALAFCIELLNQSMQVKETEMALVCALAMLGVRPQGRGFRDADVFPSVLSSIIKVAHFMIVLQARQLAGEFKEEEWAITSSTSAFEDHRSPPPRPTARSSFEWVKKMTDAFMVRGTAGPMQWILDLRAYGMKVAFNTTAEGHVGWRDGDVLEYKNIHFSMAQFRGMVDQLEHTTRRQLFNIVFAHNEQDMPAVPWKDLFDDPSNDSATWSFINDTRTQWPTDGQTWLFERIQQRPECQERFVSKQAVDGINKSTFRDWLKTIDDFRGQLLVLMHITGGQPARATEILSIRHSNTIQGRHRNLFIEDGMVVFVTQYHKGEQYKADVKIIHRYLPREVGELVVWYRWLVLPFVQRMRAWLSSARAISDHIWGEDFDGRLWTSERMKGHLQRATEAGLGHAIHIAAYRHIAIAISRKWVRPGSAFTEEETIDDGVDVADEQATHSAFTAGAIYAREMQELPGSTAGRRQQFRTASVDWHRFLGFASSIKDEVQRGVKRRGDPFQQHSKRARVDRQERLRHMDVVEEMTWMTRKEMRLRSVQPEAFQAIQRGDGKIVVVMPTGAGKSMLFMLPAFVSVGGVTVVVVPFTTLRHDMRVRCNELKISVGEWNGKKSMDGMSIVFVTPEAAIRQGFQKFLRRIQQTERLDRIVIDECHTMLGEQGGFRENIQRLGQLSSAHTQMLLVTATLAPSDEQQLFRRMFWQPDEVTLIRTSTVRPNIEYSVIDSDEEFEGFMEQLAQLVQRAIQPGGKAVVLCNDIDRIETIVQAARFPCEPFHKSMSDQARDNTFQGFRGGRVTTLIATSVFGTGIDIPDIRLFVHVTMPNHLREYGQESGRCGRDGQPSQAIIMRGRQPAHDERVRAYMDQQGCRRVALDAYLDGDTSRTQCREGEAPCDRCQIRSPPGTPPASQRAAGNPPIACPPRPSSPSPSSPVRRLHQADRERGWPDQRRIEHVRDTRVWHDGLRERLHQWKNVCALCRHHGQDSTHPISRCPHEHGRKAERERVLVQKGIQFPGMHVCYKCGVPRIICDRWSDDGRAREYRPDGFERECQFFGVLIGVIYGIKFAHREAWDEWFRMAQSDPKWPGAMVPYLGSAMDEDEGYGCQVGRAFMWLTDRVQSKVGARQ